MRTGLESTLRWTLLGIELGTLEVKGEWSDHYTYSFVQMPDSDNFRTDAQKMHVVLPSIQLGTIKVQVRWKM